MLYGAGRVLASKTARGVVAVLAAASTAGLWAGPASAADTTPPTQPGTITVSALTATSAKLTFAKSTDNLWVEGYRVYRGAATTPSSALTFIATRGHRDPVYGDAALQQHRVQVRHRRDRRGEQQVRDADGHADDEREQRHDRSRGAVQQQCEREGLLVDATRRVLGLLGVHRRSRVRRCCATARSLRRSRAPRRAGTPTTVWPRRRRTSIRSRPSTRTTTSRRPRPVARRRHRPPERC